MIPAPHTLVPGTVPWRLSLSLSRPKGTLLGGGMMMEGPKSIQQGGTMCVWCGQQGKASLVGICNL